MSNHVYTIDELKSDIGNILSGFPVEKAILFGSYAKGLADENSDIDLVIDSKGKLRGLKFFGLLEILTTKLNKQIDLIDQRDIIKNGQADKEIEKTGVVIYGE